MPGSVMKVRWKNPVSGEAPEARVNIENWDLLSITEREGKIYFKFIIRAVVIVRIIFILTKLI